MERVKKGEKYWCISRVPEGEIREHIECGDDIDELCYTNNNYFHTKEEAESMVHKLRAVLNGAEVIEMPSEEEFDEYLNSHFPYQGGTKGLICETAKGEWRLCFHYLKSKIVK